MPKKPWYQSKTILFNAFALGLITFEANLHVLQPMMSTDVYGVIAVVLAVGNKVLRVLTNQPLGSATTTTTSTEEPSNG